MTTDSSNPSDSSALGRFKNILGTLLLVLGLAILLWLVGSEVYSPTPKSKEAESTKVKSTKPSSQTLDLEILPLGRFPTFVLQASAQVQQAYRFAANTKNHKVLEALDCYCGCEEGHGHPSLLNCFIKKLLPGKKAIYAIYEEHAISCQICLKEAWDTERWLNQGKSTDQIKILIDSTYGKF